MQDCEEKATTPGSLPGGDAPKSPQWFFRAVRQVSWTVTDQAFIGIANFAGTLALARWLPPKEFGGFMAASAAFWVSGTVHTGLLAEPMVVMGSGRFRERLFDYFAVLAIFHWCISCIVSAGLAVAGFALISCGSKVSGSSLVGYALAAPMILLLTLLRRAFYVRLLPRLAAGTACSYMVGMLAIIYMLYRLTLLSAFTAPLAAGGGSALAIGSTLLVSHIKLWSRWKRDFMQEVARFHWRYGSWSTISQLLISIPGTLYYIILPLLVGLQNSAALRALMILMMPAAQMNLAFTLLLPPIFVQIRQNRWAKSLIWAIFFLLITCATLYMSFIFLFGRPLMELLYQGKYTEYVSFSWLIGLIALPHAAIAVLGSVLRAYERPDRVFWSYAVSTLVSSVFGVAAVATWGLLGAILGLIAAYTITALVMLWWCLRPDSWAEPRTVTEISARKERSNVRKL